MTPPEGPATGTDDALALAERAGIHRIDLPTPFLVGRINCYLIEDDPLTLIDTGPNSGKSLDDLERALGAHGRRVEGPRADRAHPPAHGPHRAARDPGTPGRRRGRRAAPPAALPGGLLAQCHGR